MKGGKNKRKIGTEWDDQKKEKDEKKAQIG